MAAPAAITAVVLTRDEAEHLPGCLASLGFADAVLVVDSESRDATRDIARASGARVVVHRFVNFSRQRQAALAHVATPWVLFVDADERVPPALAAEARRAASSGAAAGYWIPRENLFWGHRLRGGGWWPDRQLRLLDVARARYDPDRAVHEVAEVDGPTAALDSPLVHLNYASWAEFRAKQRAYARLEAVRRTAAGERWKPQHVVTRPAREAWRRYVTLSGWRDGWLGIALALAMAWYEARAGLELARLGAALPGRRGERPGGDSADEAAGRRA